jgi:peptidoglycan/LPS O-acetylase OafA/YrhL
VPLRRRLNSIFLVVVAFLAVFTVFEKLELDKTLLFPLYFTATALFFGSLMVYAIFAGEGRGARLMRSRALAFFGQYGYGLYVFHVPLVSIAALAGFNPGSLSWIGSEFLDAVAYVAAMTALSTATALLSWHLWEKQFLKLKPVLLERQKQARIQDSGLPASG